VKAITLTQPWATLVAIGAKRIETRSWRTHYRGPLAIHAAKALPPEWRISAWDRRFAELLESLCGLDQYGAPDLAQLPAGMVLATATLAQCTPTDTLHPSGQEHAFGDFTPGRWGWLLENAQPLPTPITATGHLGLWNWSEAQPPHQPRALSAAPSSPFAIRHS